MKTTEKGILINAIISYLKENIKAKNHALTKQNLWSEQESFSDVDLFFKLAFMTDNEVKKIAGLII